jgi:chromosome partitioning protein
MPGMAQIIAVTGLKGGVGKSTLALNLATCFHRAGRRTLLVDADTQGTVRAWAAVAAETESDGPPVVAIDARTLARDLGRVAKDYDVAIVDCPARLGAESRAAMVTADLVLLPVLPGAADVWALKQTVEVLDEARAIKPDLEARIVVNRTDRTTLAGLARENIEGLGVDILGDGLGNRVAFGEATLAGRGVIDYAPSSPAAEEMTALFKHVTRIIDRRTDGKGKKR